MITVHHLNNSRSQRILWLLEELKIPYEVKYYQRDVKTMKGPKTLLEIHPLAKSPIITDDSADDVVTVAESGAIIEYLIRTYGRETFAPSEKSSAYRDYIYWLHFAEGSLMPPFLIRLLFEKVKSSPMPFFIKPVAKAISNKVMNNFISPEITNLMGYIDTYLKNQTWFAGDSLSGADIQMSFPLEAAVASGSIDGQYSNIHSYVKRFQSRSEYLAALEKGGDYAYGPSNDS